MALFGEIVLAGTTGSGTRWAAGPPRDPTATRWVDRLTVLDAEVLARYDHPHFGRWPAATTRRQGAGRITYVGTVSRMGPRHLPRHMAGAHTGQRMARPPRLFHRTIATSPDERRVHVVHNWSWKPARATAPVRDVVNEVFAVDHAQPRQRNLPAVLRVARTVADAAAAAADGGAVPLVLGGDCTITLGVVAGLQRRDPDVGLFYFDGDADLAHPGQTGSGVLDAMVVAHLLGIADSDLARLGGDPPMLTERRLVLFGTDETDPETFHETVLGQRQLLWFADHRVRADPVGCATAALAALHASAGGVVVHFDVDAVDSGDLPLANFPHYGTGVTLAQAGQALGVALGSPALAAIVLTEVNPSHDPRGTQLQRYVEVVADAIATGVGHRSGGDRRAHDR